MAIFYYGNTFTSSLTINNPSCDVILGAGAPTRVMEISLHNNSASSNQLLGIARSDAASVQTGAASLWPADDTDAVSRSTIASAWSVAPNIANPLFYRRTTLTAIQGSFCLFSFMRGLLLLPGGSSIMVWNIGTITTGLFINFTADE